MILIISVTLDTEKDTCMSKLSQRKHLIDLVNQLELQIFEPLYDNEHTKAGHWDYITYSIGSFLAHMEEVRKLIGPDKKFIDVGCGIGTKVHLASHYFDAYGVELHPPYAKSARKLTRTKKFHKFGGYTAYHTRHLHQRIFQTDALKFNYSGYDVVYFFRPMSNDKMQKELEQRIYKQVKPGTIIIPIYAISDFPSNIKHLQTPSKKLYVKVRDKQHFQNLNRRAKKLFG
jgi:hypothetical protein